MTSGRAEVKYTIKKESLYPFSDPGEPAETSAKSQSLKFDMEYKRYSLKA